MSRQLSVLSNVRIASPCTVPWSSMHGDNRTRHCGQCSLNVFNLADMTRPEAEALILSANGRLCIRYYQRWDGTIMTSDCPDAVRAIRRRLARAMIRIAAVFALLAGGLHALARGPRGSGDLRLRYFEPFAPIIRWMTPPPRIRDVMGVVFCPATSLNHEDQLEDPEAVALLEISIDELDDKGSRN